jgi:hypothetical protein
MNKEAQRIAIAETCGWKTGYRDPEAWHPLPDYLNDLNAMHEAENVLFGRNDWSSCKYDEYLDVATSSWKWNATASQRAEAFLRTIGKWEESK